MDLGRGALATTYLAEDLNLKRKVALKVIDCAAIEQEKRDDFEREARDAALLRHRNIATVHYLGTDQSHFFYAMDYVEGRTAEQCVFGDGPMKTAVALEVALQVSRALAAASRNGLKHGDIKPANLMISVCPSGDDETPLVKVIDWGFAEPSGARSFASPEQLAGGSADIRSDIYSLGATVWFLLTGEAPFAGLEGNIQNRSAHPPLKKLAKFPRPVRDLLGQMLAKDPEDRPNDPSEVAERIQFCLGQVQRREALIRHLRAPVTMAQRGWTALRPHAGVGAVVMLLAAAMTAGMLALASGRLPRFHPTQPRKAIPTADAKSATSISSDSDVAWAQVGEAEPNATATASPMALTEDLIWVETNPAFAMTGENATTSDDGQVHLESLPDPDHVRGTSSSGKHHIANSRKSHPLAPLVIASRRLKGLFLR